MGVAVAIKYRKSSIKPPRGLFISNPFEGGLIEMGGLFERGAYKVEKWKSYKVEKLTKWKSLQSGKAQVQEVLGHAAKDQY